jgi:2-desacetyl-2-hydroxyethyl bacteriochlorophyllide A dehydrogenase
MRAIQLVETGSQLVERLVGDPAPGPEDVVVRVMAAGICHTDVHYRRGVLAARLPVTLGHEVAGVVLAIGTAVRTLKPGDRVCLHYLATCGSCPECLAGHDQFCLQAEMIGKHRDGGFAEQIVMPARSVVALPENVPFEFGAIAMCSAVTSYHALRKGRLSAGETVAVIGVGGLGIAALQLARVFGACQVLAVDINPHKLERAATLGATGVDASRGDPVACVRRLTGERGVDVALDLVGRGATTRQALAMLAPGGRVVVVGISREQTEIDTFSQILAREGELIGCSDHLRSEVSTLLEMISRGMIDLALAVTRTVPLEAAAINAALDDLEKGGDALRTVIVP